MVSSLFVIFGFFRLDVSSVVIIAFTFDTFYALYALDDLDLLVGFRYWHLSGLLRNVFLLASFVRVILFGYDL